MRSWISGSRKALALVLAGLLWSGCGGGSSPGGEAGTSGAGEAAAVPAIPAPPIPGRENPDLLPAGLADAGAPAPDPSATLALEAGWNLVSFGVGQVTSVAADAGVHPNLFYYDNSSGSYRLVALGAAALNGAGTARGYWAYASQASQIRYQGTGTMTAGNLAAGWNLVGLPGSAVRLGDVEAVTGGGTRQALTRVVSPVIPPPAGTVAYSRAFSYSPSGGQYQVVDLADAGTRTAAGRAVWVYGYAAAAVSWLPGPAEGGLPGSGPPAPGTDAPPPSPPPAPGPPPAPNQPGPS